MSSIRSFHHFRPGQIAAQHRFYTQRSRQSTCSWVHDVALIHSRYLASGTSNHKADWSVYFILFMESDTCPLGSQRAQQSNQDELTSVYCPLHKRKSYLFVCYDLKCSLYDDLWVGGAEYNFSFFNTYLIGQASTEVTTRWYRPLYGGNRIRTFQTVGRGKRLHVKMR